MKLQLLRALNWLRLLDEQGLLSLTNIAVWVIVAKLAMSTQVNFAEVAGLLTVLGGYHLKSYTKSRLNASSDASASAFKSLQNEVDKLKLAVGFTQNDNR